MLGQTLRGRYRIIRQLGSGGFGETYLAEDKDLPGSPLCVVKQLKPKTSEPSLLQTARRLFDREAQVLYRLGNHDQIPQLFAHFEENQEFYLVQEYIDGEPLNQLLSGSTPGCQGSTWGGQLNEAETITLLQDVLETLAFVHQQNVIHRDIKPSNLIRRRVDGKLVLIDFGAVKEIETMMFNPQGEISGTILVGSPGYMPNEQQGGKPRFSSDIYALGMTAIQALTGVCPDELPEDSQTGEISWREYTQVSNHLAAILDRMVRSHFRDRYQTVAEVLNDLGHLQNTTAAPTQYMLLTRLRQHKLLQSSSWLPILVTVGMIFIGSKLLHSIPTESQSILSAPIVTPSPTPQIPEAVESYNQGKTLIELGRYDEAIATLDKALQLQPQYPEAWVGRGEALWQLQKYDEALKAYDEALKSKSNYAEAWYHRGVVLAKLQRDREALASLEKAVTIQSNYAEAWYHRGAVLAKLQRDQEALTSLDQAVQNKTDYAEAWYQRGIVLNKLQRYEDALTSLAQALQFQPANAEIWIAQGKALEKLQKYNEAIASFDKALQFDGNSWEAWGERGHILGHLKQYEEAIASLDKAVQIKQDYAEAWLSRGIILEKLQKYDDAIAAFDKAGQIKQDYSEAWYRRAIVLEKIRKYDDAIAAYEKAIQIWPANEEAIENRKRLSIKLKR